MKPGSVLQFGAGNFLRAFVDLFLCENPGRSGRGEVNVVQSTGRERADALNACGGAYHVAIQGNEGGRIVDEVRRVDSIGRALVADAEWDAVLAAACSPELEWIVSNVTEAGLEGGPPEEDRVPGHPPTGYPGKLLEVLLARHRAGLPGPVILPCELVENNGHKLREAVLARAQLRQLPASELDWLREGCVWTSTLVDRIVPGKPSAHPLLESDPLLLTTEPFAFWAIASPRPWTWRHPAIEATDDLAPFFLRKVRLLNGAHTALAARAMPLGFETVGQCLADPGIRAWLEELLFEEIVPAIEDQVGQAEWFARMTLERFANPFHAHRLAAIALHHETKLATRLRPSLRDYQAKFGREPRILASLCP